MALHFIVLCRYRVFYRLKFQTSVQEVAADVVERAGELEREVGLNCCDLVIKLEQMGRSFLTSKERGFLMWTDSW